MVVDDSGCVQVGDESTMYVSSSCVVERSCPGRQAHYAILKQWAEKLVRNALDPDLQDQTDGFTGFVAHSVNLAFKGIIGIGAMSRPHDGWQVSESYVSRAATDGVPARHPARPHRGRLEDVEGRLAHGPRRGPRRTRLVRQVINSQTVSGSAGGGRLLRPADVLNYVSRVRSPVIRAASCAAISTRSWNSDHPSGRLLTVGW